MSRDETGVLLRRRASTRPRCSESSSTRRTFRFSETPGFEIDFVSKLHELRPVDLFFVWWWTWALAPIAFAKTLGRPVLVTGVLDINYYEGRPWWHQAGMRRAFAMADANVFTSELEFRDLPRRFAVRNPSYVPLTVDDAPV
jgi:hypothetical protein